MERVHEHAFGKRVQHTPPDFGFLPAEAAAVANALVMLCIAIEARANHMIDEVAEDGKWRGKLSPDAVKRQHDFWQKWSRLPHNAGVGSGYDKAKHRVVLEVFEYRDLLMHAKFDEAKSLPGPKELVALYSRWIDAMDEMNCIVRSVPRNPEIQKLKVFTPIA
jgi:hypothetical protein